MLKKLSSIFLLALMLSHISPVSLQAEVSEIIGDVRVQVLSPTLVRIEQRGPAGFENRNTFHIVERNWQGADITRSISNGIVTINAGNYAVRVPENAADLNDIDIVDSQGQQLWAMPYSTEYTTIKCRWEGTGVKYLCDDGDMVGYGSSPQDDRYYWKIDQADGYVTICNKATGEYMNIENMLDYVECTPVESHWDSKNWIVTETEGFKRLQCRWGEHMDYIHVENTAGFAQHSPAGTTNADGTDILHWWSILWDVSGVNSSFFSNNRHWLPHPKENTKAWAFCDTPRYVPAPWGYNLAESGVANYEVNGWDLDNDARDVYVFLPAGDGRQLRNDYIRLTGRTDLIPMYALGGWDSRYYPYTQQEALDKIDRYRAEEIPLDVFVVDTDWRVGASHGYSVNTDLFPDMEGFLSDAHDNNVMITFNDHPEPQADIALDPVEVAYRNDGLRSKFDIGLDFWWFDRNWHTSLIPPSGINKEVFGMYIFKWITQDYYQDRRPILMANFDGIDNGYLNRAPDIAAHRFTMQWTGDTTCDYASLTREVENAVFSGVHGPFAYLSTDLGGHQGTPSTEQYCRWVEFGALSPIFRLHCTAGVTRDPWMYDEPALDIVRDYVQMRMRLMPLLYNSARDNYDSGEPILRRCDLDYPEFIEAETNLQYLLGKGILAAPVCEGSGDAVSGSWLRTSTGASGIDARYYANMTLSGVPVLETVEGNIDHNWRQSSPNAIVPIDGFSARYSGVITSGANIAVELGLISDDGCRMWLNDQLVVDQWQDQAEIACWSGEIIQPGESASLKVEYFENAGDAVCRLVWRAVDGNISRDLWLPPGTWVDCWNGKLQTGPANISRSTSISELPLYVKAGTIVTLAEDMAYTNQKPWDTMILDIYPGSDIAQARIYEDDRMSNDYASGAYRTTNCSALVNDAQHSVNVAISPAEGTYPDAVSQRSWKLRLRTPFNWHEPYRVSSVKVNGNVVTFNKIARDPAAMPFAVDGGARDSDIVLIELPASAVTEAKAIEILYELDWRRSDLDASGFVDIADVAELVSSWLMLNCGLNNWCNGADIDHDGKVGMVDVAMMLEDFGKGDGLE